VENSETFIKLIQDINIPGEDYLVSSDVVSLFSHVPVEVLQIIRNRVSTNSSFPERSPLQVGNIMELLNVCLITTYSQFQNKLPHRVKMGVVHSLIKRAKVTCQDQKDFNNEIKNVRHDLILIIIKKFVALVRKPTTPTERPLLVGEVSTNLCG
jgi:hypothetical protein